MTAPQVFEPYLFAEARAVALRPGSIVRLASDPFGHPGILLRTQFLDAHEVWAHLVAIGVTLRGRLEPRNGSAIVTPPGVSYGEYRPTHWSVFTAHRVAWYAHGDVEHLKRGPAQASEELRARLEGILVGKRHYLASQRDTAHVGTPIAFEANP